MRTLFLIWKADERRGENIPIGRLDFDAGIYVFQYIEGLKKARKLGFSFLPEFPDLLKTYESRELFPLFANRLMSPKRRDFNGLIEALGLVKSDSPLFYLEVLGRSTGRKATDRFRLFLKPEKEGNEFTITCFTTGLSRDSFYESVRNSFQLLERGDEIRLVSEKENEYDKYAIKVLHKDDYELGYVPAFYSTELSPLLERNTLLSCKIQKINRPFEAWLPDSILIEIRGEWPPGWEPFAKGDYENYQDESSSDAPTRATG